MLITGHQLKAARALAGIGQVALAEAAGLHAQSIRYLERQEAITDRQSYSRDRVVDALELLGVNCTADPLPGVVATRPKQPCQ